MLIRNATLPDGRTGIDVLVEDGLIVAIGPQLPEPEGIEQIDLRQFRVGKLDEQRLLPFLDHALALRHLDTLAQQ